MASRTLGSSGADHVSIEDWEAWATNVANFTVGGTWDDPTNGGPQVLRMANEKLAFTSHQNIDADALVTSTNFKVTIRPNTEGGVTAVGTKVGVDGTFNPLTTTKTPWLAQDAGNHIGVIDVSSSPNIEWHFEGLHIDPDHQRSGPIYFGNSLTRNAYIDRCILRMSSGGGNPFMDGGASGSAVGRIYLRSCFISAQTVGWLWTNASGLYVLGNTIGMVADTTTVIQGVGSQLPVTVYGNAFWSGTDGHTGAPATNIATGANFPNNYNVANYAGTNWTDDFTGAGNVANSTRAAMFVSTTNQYPLAAGALDSVVVWGGLPADVQAGWPDTDFLGTTIVKSDSFSAGAIFVAGEVVDPPDPSAIQAQGVISVTGIMS